MMSTPLILAEVGLFLLVMSLIQAYPFSHTEQVFMYLILTIIAIAFIFTAFGKRR